MTITRVWQGCADWNSVSAVWSDNNSGATTASNLLSPGSYAWDIGPDQWYAIDLPSTYTQCQGGFYFRHGGQQTITDDWLGLFALYNGTETAFGVRINNGTQNWELAKGGFRDLSDGTRTNNNTVDTASYGTFFADTGTWYWFGWDYYYHAVNGWIRVWINATLLLEFDGDTTTSTDFTVPTSVASAVFGSSEAFFNGGSGLDDDWIDGAFMHLFFDNSSGEGSAAKPDQRRFELYRPDGDSSVAWAVNGGGGTHYEVLDDVPPDENTYIKSATDSQLDELDLATITVPTDEEVRAVWAVAQARSNQGLEGIVFGLKDTAANTDDTGTVSNISKDQGVVVGHAFATAPDGGAWSEAKAEDTGLKLRMTSDIP